jgi:hypothetical protein
MVSSWATLKRKLAACEAAKKGKRTKRTVALRRKRRATTLASIRHRPIKRQGICVAGRASPRKLLFASRAVPLLTDDIEKWAVQQYKQYNELIDKRVPFAAPAVIQAARERMAGTFYPTAKQDKIKLANMYQNRAYWDADLKRQQNIDNAFQTELRQLYVSYAPESLEREAAVRVLNEKYHPVTPANLRALQVRFPEVK